jgi:hypothetical protein
MGSRDKRKPHVPTTNPTTYVRRKVTLDGLGICLDINATARIRQLHLQSELLKMTSEEKDKWLKEKLAAMGMVSSPAAAASSEPSPKASEDS